MRGVPVPDNVLHAVLDSLGVAMLVIDVDGRFVFTNQAAQQMFGSAQSVDRLSFVEVTQLCDPRQPGMTNCPGPGSHYASACG